MSPATLRRFRAERLLREEFDGLSDRVIAGARARLRLAGVRLDRSDLEAAYSQAWQGLYAAVLDGEQIDDPSAWLALVTYRRAIDEHRARSRLGSLELDRPVDSAGGHQLAAGGGTRPGASRRASGAAGESHDIAAELDDRTRLRQLFEALRGRLSEREQQAATLCYLQGLSRAEAAARMGVSVARMRKLMEGRGAGAPGVAGKVGALVETIRAGAWCEEQGSLMRGFAYGILDPDGERYALALMHRDECPACRAYILSLRGLAAVLPPVPSLLHLVLGGSAAAVGAGSVAGSGAGTGASSLAGSGSAAGAVAPACSGVGGALSASGAAGAAGGGWWLAAGPLGAKLAVSCALALGIGAGCVALEGRSGAGHSPRARHGARAHASGGRVSGGVGAFTAVAQGAGAPLSGSVSNAVRSAAARAPIAASAQASREFGPEGRARAGGAGLSASATGGAASAHAASVGSGAGAGGAGSGGAAGTEFSGSGAAPARAASAAAQREFAPG